MRDSVIQFRPSSGLVLLRRDYVEICDGNHCAAMVLAQHQYWHEIMLGRRSQARQDNQASTAQYNATGKTSTGVQRTNAWVWKRQTDMQSELLGMFGLKAIRDAYVLLAGKRFLQYKQDRSSPYSATKQYFFCVSAVQAAVRSLPPINLGSSGEDDDPEDAEYENQGAVSKPEEDLPAAPAEQYKPTENEANMGIGKTAEPIGRNAHKGGRNALCTDRNAALYKTVLDLRLKDPLYPPQVGECSVTDKNTHGPQEAPSLPITEGSSPDRLELEAKPEAPAIRIGSEEAAQQAGTLPEPRAAAQPKPAQASEKPLSARAVSRAEKQAERAEGERLGQRAVALYCEGFKVRYGENPVVTGQAARSLHGVMRAFADAGSIAETPEERFGRAMTKFFACADDWLLGTRHGAPMFEKHLNKWDVPAPKPPPAAAAKPAPSAAIYDDRYLMDTWKLLPPDKLYECAPTAEDFAKVMLKRASQLLRGEQVNGLNYMVNIFGEDVPLPCVSLPVPPAAELVAAYQRGELAKLPLGWLQDALSTWASRRATAGREARA